MRYLIVLILGLAQAAHAIDPQQFDSPEQEARYKDLIAELRCLKCQNQNLADSPADLAGDLRNEVLRMMKAGQSNAEIKTFLTDRYGDFVLYRPPLKPSTWVLWFGPGLLLIIGAIALFTTLRRRLQTDPNAIADPEQEELDQRLRDIEEGRL